MTDLISRQEAISLPIKPREDRYFQTHNLDDAYDYGWRSLQGCIEKLPSAQLDPSQCWGCNCPKMDARPERTEYIPDTKAIPSERDCVDLSERVTVTFYDEEYEEWSQKTVTIRDVLNSVCDEYTVLSSAQPDTTQRIIKRDGQTHWYECLRCGTAVDSMDKFCRGCGRRFEEGT